MSSQETVTLSSTLIWGDIVNIVSGVLYCRVQSLLLLRIDLSK